MGTIGIIVWAVFGAVVGCFISTLEVRYMKKSIWGDVNRPFEKYDYSFVNACTLIGIVAWPIFIVVAIVVGLYRRYLLTMVSPASYLSTFFQKILKGGP